MNWRRDLQKRRVSGSAQRVSIGTKRNRHIVQNTLESNPIRAASHNYNQRRISMEKYK